jgi:hypothetical protein
MNECASVDQAYMDGVYLHEKIFKKEKWYEWHTQMMKYETLMKTSLAVREYESLFFALAIIIDIKNCIMIYSNQIFITIWFFNNFVFAVAKT